MDNTFMEIIKYTVPVLLVLIFAYFFLRSSFKNEENRRRYDLYKSAVSIITPVRLTAYERVV